MSENMELARNELLEEIRAYTKSVCSDFGIATDIADQVGTALADQLADNWGGQIVTFPKDHKYKLAMRDIEIYNEFNGRNHGELARRYQMTVRGIYKVIKRVKQRGIPGQQSLF